MKKQHLFIASFFFLIGVLFLAEPALADYRDDLVTQLGATAQGAEFGEARDPRLVASLIIRSLLSLLGMGFLVYTVYAGYIWMSSAGDEEKISNARATIRRSVLGLIIILSAYSITAFVTRIITPTQQPLQDGVRLQIDEEPFETIEVNQRRFLNPDPLNQ